MEIVCCKFPRGCLGQCLGIFQGEMPEETVGEIFVWENYPGECKGGNFLGGMFGELSMGEFQWGASSEEMSGSPCRITHLYI